MPLPRIFRRQSRIAAPAAELFAWHARPGAFERLNPPWNPVRVRERHGGIRDGARVTIEVPVAGPFGIPWQLEHRDYEEGRQFRDVQRRGPFAAWEHTHRMHPDGERTSILDDEIRYALPLAPLANLLAGGVAERELDRLFTYRHAVTAGDLAAHRAANPDHRRLTIAVTGATGFVGSALCAYLTTDGHTVRRVSRRAPRPGSADIRWDPARHQLDARDLAGVDAVIHLAGESVGQRWTHEVKRRIRESRVEGTSLLARTLVQLDRRPAVLVSASAVGIYGRRGDEPLDETSATGDDFLARVGEEWEAAADPARAAGVRVVHPRIGVVLGPEGGALERLLPPFRLGLGGPIGSGDQWMSWIARDDLLGALEWMLFDASLAGPVNATAPEPVTNAEFTRTLARVLHRPAPFRVPGVALRLVFGEMADATLLEGQRVRPRRLEAAGFRFRHPTLRDALATVLGRAS